MHAKNAFQGENSNQYSEPWTYNGIHSSLNVIYPNLDEYTAKVYKYHTGTLQVKCCAGSQIYAHCKQTDTALIISSNPAIRIYRSCQ